MGLFSSMCFAVGAMRSMGWGPLPGDIDQHAIHVKASEAVGAFAVAFDRFSQLISVAYSSESGPDISRLARLLEVAAKADVFFLKLRKLQLDVSECTAKLSDNEAGIRVAQFLRSIAELCGSGQRGCDRSQRSGDIHALLQFADENYGSDREKWAMQMIECLLASQVKIELEPVKEQANQKSS